MSRLNKLKTRQLHITKDGEEELVNTTSYRLKIENSLPLNYELHKRLAYYVLHKFMKFN